MRLSILILSVLALALVVCDPKEDAPDPGNVCADTQVIYEDAVATVCADATCIFCDCDPATEYMDVAGDGTDMAFICSPLDATLLADIAACEASELVADAEDCLADAEACSAEYMADAQVACEVSAATEDASE